MTVRVDRVVTSGTFSLDGGTWDVDNNIWLIGDDSEVVVVDAAHTAQPIIDAVAGRRVVAVVCTHGHNDHVTVAPQLGERLDAPVLLHPADEVLWEMTHPGLTHGTLADGQRISVAGTEIQVLHTPGHSPGSSCLYVQEAGVLCTGDTLFAGGPGRVTSQRDFETIMDSLEQRIFGGQFPDSTTFLPGHGEGGMLGDERARLVEYRERGWQ